MNKRKLLTLAMTLCMVAILAIGGTLAYFTDTTNEIQNTFAMGKVDITLDEAPVGKDGKKTDGPRVESNDYTKTNMVPGYVFDKDPTIHVDANSEDSYIFLDMTINKFNSLFWVMAADADADEKIDIDLNKFIIEGKFSSTAFVTHLSKNKATMQAIVGKWFKGIEHEKWTVKDIIITTDGKYLTLRLAYNGIAKAGNDIKFMDSFQMPASVTQKMIEEGTTIGGMQHAFNATKEVPFHMNFKAYAIQAAELANVNAAYKALFGVDAQY